MSFTTLGLAAELLRAIEEQGYTQPTLVQEQAIPTILTGSDMIVGSQTGTGKTAGFTLPVLHRLSLSAGKGGAKTKGPRFVRALILTPTRELAAQVSESVRGYSKYLPLRSTVVFGGVSLYPQMKALRAGVDLLVATPGRLLDHVRQGNLDLSRVETFVLDEADRMLDMGFIHDIRKILELLPAKRQSLLFSATFSPEVRALADGFLQNPQVIESTKPNTTAEGISQTVYAVDTKRKRELLSHLITSENWDQVLVFTRTKHGANRLSEQLEQDGIRSTAVHGNKTQAARAKALADFKRGKVRVLVATDIAARGLDIDKLGHVVNFELPNVPEDYVHRIGRTGRAGNVGNATSLVCRSETGMLRGIERLLKVTIPKIVLPGYEPDPKQAPAVRADHPFRAGKPRNGRSDEREKGRFAKAGAPAGRSTSSFRPRREKSFGDFKRRSAV